MKKVSIFLALAISTLAFGEGGMVPISTSASASFCSDGGGGAVQCAGVTLQPDGGLSPGGGQWLALPDAGGIYSATTTVPAIVSAGGTIISNVAAGQNILVESAGGGSLSRSGGVWLLRNNLNIAGNDTAYVFSSNSVAGNDAYAAANNGAHWHFGGGASDYASSDGTTVTFAGPVNVSGAFTLGVPTLPACGSGNVNTITAQLGGASEGYTKLCICRSDGAATPSYQWCSLSITDTAAVVCTGGSTTVCP